MITVRCTQYSEKAKNLLEETFLSLHARLVEECPGRCRKCELSRLCDDAQRVLFYLNPPTIPEDPDVHN